METKQEIIKKYEQKFTDLFAEFYEAMKGDVRGISCEKTISVLQPGGMGFFVGFKVW